MQFILRFVIGGAVVTFFALLADILKPKSFAGLFGAAPSIAIATLALTVATEGKSYAAIEARSMVWGAIAFCAYAYFCMHVMLKRSVHASGITMAGLILWAAFALGGWMLFLR